MDGVVSDLPIPTDFERQITLGFSRAASPVGEAQALSNLAVLAQHKRHRRAAPAPAVGGKHAGAIHSDPRPIMPEAARRPLVRLGASLGKDAWHLLAPPIFDQLDRCGVRLHPFDLPRLEHLLAAAPDRLGTAERAWMNLKRSPESEAAAAPTSEDDWRLLPKAQKAAVARQLRAADPAMARTRIEQHLASAPADVRAALVATLEVRLSGDDVALLTTVATDDRATSVREAANALLGSIRGTPAHAARLTASAAYIELGRTMLGRRTAKLNAAALADRLPAGTTTGQRNHLLAAQIYRELEGLLFSDIAKALSLPPADLANALVDDDLLTPPLILAALIEGDAKLLAKLAPHVARLDVMDLVRTLGQSPGLLSKDSRASILDAAAQSSSLKWHNAWDLAILSKIAGGIVPEALARRLLNPSSWPTATSSSNQIDTIALATLASLMPSGCEAALSAAIADLPRKDTAAAFEYLSFAAALQGQNA